MSLSPDDTLPLRWLFHWERARADRVWLVQPVGGGGVREYSWKQAVEQARRMATHLRRNHQEGSRIAILGKNSAWWFIADTAIWMAGMVSVPIYPSLTGASMKQILDLSGACALFLGRLDDWTSMRSGIAEGFPVIRMPQAGEIAGTEWDSIVADNPPLRGEIARGADELATIVYTSGTTGLPKGVMHGFAAMGRAGAILAQVCEVGAQDRLLSYLPAAHVADRLFSLLLSLASGCRVYFTDSLDTFAQDLRRARPTVFLSVPRLWSKFQAGVLARMPPQKLSLMLKVPLLGGIVRRKITRALGLEAVRVAMSGTSPLPADLVQWYRSLGIEIHEGYGMTENFSVSHSSVACGARVGYVGTCLPGVTMRFSDTGEVLVKSPCAMLGYYDDAKTTRDALTDDGYFRTGDLGSVDESGRLRITGRAKEQFKTSKGKYVAPAPIENRLCNHPMVEASLVAGAGFGQPFALLMLPNGAWQRLCQSELDRSELMRSLEEHRLEINRQLDPHERLDFVVVVPEQWTVDNGFVTPTLKVKRAAVEAHYAPQFDGWLQQRQPVMFLQ